MGTGSGPYNSNATLTYNGSTWTTVPATINTIRRSAAASGTQTAALFFGGITAAPANALSAATESYNGTAWTSTSSMATARHGLGGSGTQTSALAFGGISPPTTAATEEFTGPSIALQTKTITTS